MKVLARKVRWGIAIMFTLSVVLSSISFAAPIKLKYWTLFGGPDGAVMEDMVKQFNASQSDIQIDFNIIDWGGNYYGKLGASIAAGNAPDIAIVHTRNLPEFAYPSALYTIDEYLAENGFKSDQFQTLPWKGTQVGGKQYAIPLDVIIAMVLYYNKDHLAKAGIANPPQNGAEYLAAAQKMKAATGQWGAYVPLGKFILYRYWYSLLYQNGGQLLSDDLKTAAFNSSAGINALQYWVDNVYKRQLSPETELGGAEGFRFGKVSMLMDGIWMHKAFAAQKNLNFGVATMPAFYNNGDRSFFSNSHNFIFPKPKKDNIERLKASIKFVKWMSDHSLTWGDKGKMVPARSDIIASPDYQNLPLSPSLLNQVKFAKYPPPITKTSEIQKVIIQNLEMAMARKKTPQQALSDASEGVNDVLSE